MHNDSPSYQLIGLAGLMRQAFTGESLLPLSNQMIAYAEQHPQDANVLMDLSTVLLLLNHCESGMAVQREALAMQQVYTVGAPRPGALRLLIVKAAGELMANTPVELLVENRDVALMILYVGPGIPAPESLPQYDVLMTAIGHGTENAAALAMLAKNLPLYPNSRQIINHPAAIARLERATASLDLASLPGIAMPRTSSVELVDLDQVADGRATLDSIAPGLALPVIVRPDDSHAGHGLARIDTIQGLREYLDQSAGNRFYVAPFIDYRSADGQYRKYRVILIDGAPFICHMGISSHWMVHYLNAGMAESADKRAEEAQCMAGFDAGFARRHQAALAAIADATGLAYVGIDCAETRDGELLVFEVDSDMIVHNLDSPAMYPYKAPHMEKLFDGFMALLKKRSTQ